MRIILIIINLGKIYIKRDNYELKGKVFISNEDE